MHRSIAAALILIFACTTAHASPPVPFHGIYLPGQCLTPRRIDKVLHYAPLAGINAVVLHAKDPRGRLYWDSRHAVAEPMGASVCKGQFQRAVRRLRAQGIWVVAKLDVFIDARLVSHHPHLGVKDRQTEAPWADRHGLHWANPHDPAVWRYNIELARELARLGVDEIQFDYVRFPTDGDLERIVYPRSATPRSPAKTIGAFVAEARMALRGESAVISADLFGLTAWKTADFGVGQVIEEIAPHVDILCPMLYPSHFPPGFLGWKQPGRHPREIMRKSLERLEQRTDRPLRPWVQGFWYTPEEINAQLDGIADTGRQDWSVWNPTGNYEALYRAVSNRTGKAFPLPTFYPSLEILRQQPPRRIRGHRRTVHYTDPGEGFSILSLEAPVEGARPYHTLQIVLNLLDEAVMDRILTGRGTPVSSMTGRGWKIGKLVQIVTEDLNLSPRKIRPRPIYVDWSPNGPCRFTWVLPQNKMEIYRGSDTEARP